MKCRTHFGEAARDELLEARAQLRLRSPRSAQAFDEAFQATARNIEAHPRSSQVWTHFGDLEIRRTRIGRFPYFLFYIVYPSVDFNTGEALDVVGVLACRHEKQAEPNWGARDPFRLPS